MPNALTKVKKAIKLAKEKGFEIHTETTITKLNQNNIPQIIELAKKLGVDYFFIRSIVVAGCAEKNLMITKEEYKKALETVYKAKYPLGKMKITSQDPLFHLVDKKLMQKLENKYGDIYSGKYVGGCSAGLNSLNIKSDGSVKLCSFLTQDLGNIRFKKLKEIWKNKNKICKDIISRNIQGKCKICKDKLICGGCRARANILTNNILGEDPYCWKKIN
ncbi:MAG: pyrroloquinoline quinone biosynthesis protein PqqE [archaeon ADurb.Bin336]|jgi:radical SAM protein with 4Fe4S-binding SPASM domain|nr:MAG: pyrroloquinoline quinone biosynthesis protein PqqE [archaeon ADurb.Bin336]